MKLLFESWSSFQKYNLKLKPDIKTAVFPISLPFPLYTGNNTLSLPNVITSIVNFVTACKRLRRLHVLAGTSDSKTQNYTTLGFCDIKVSDMNTLVDSL